MNNETDLPLISVAMPLHNEEKHLDEALNSILGQDYQNIEIIIADNHSTDKTADICRHYAGRDTRITYHRHAKNIGVGPNFIFTFNNSRGKYFMWASGHDKWDSGCISKCINLLEKHDDATLAFGTPVWIGEDGQLLNKFSGWYDTRGLSTVARFFMVFWGSMNPVLGVFRKKDLPDLTRYNYAGADLTLLTSLALKGVFIHAHETCLYRRQNRAIEDHNDRMNRYKGKEMKVANSLLGRLFPLAKLPFKIIIVVIRTKIILTEKICVLALLLPSIPIRYIVGKKSYQLRKDPITTKIK